VLVLVVGPSGAGKDTVIDGARAALGDDTRFRFVRRVVTRPVEPGGEAVSEKTFFARRDAGGFALHWRANGFYYGIPADIALDLAAPRVVVVNISRALIAEAAQRFPVRVIEVTAPPDILARRLAARGRQDAVDVARRLGRSITLKLPIERETIVNDGTVGEAVRSFIAALNRAASGAPPA